MLDINLSDKDVKEAYLNTKPLKLLVNNDLKQMICDHLFQKYDIKMSCTNKYFKSVIPEDDLNNLKKYKHLVYPNTNQRIQLIVLLKFGDKPACLLIDKQNSNFYLLKCQFNLNLYQETVFEGEVVDACDGNSYFMISDFLVYLGKNIVGHPFDKRLNLLKSIISKKNYTFDLFLDPFRIIVKDFVGYDELKSYVHDYIPISIYREKVSGLIFRPLENSNKNLIYNFNKQYVLPTYTQNLIGSTSVGMSSKPQTPSPAPTLPFTQNSSPVPAQTVAPKQLKINTEKHREVKFMMFESGMPDDYCLKLLGDDDILFTYNYALINDMKTSKTFQEIFENIDKTAKNSGICTVCKYVQTFGKWKPVSFIREGHPDRISNLV